MAIMRSFRNELQASEKDQSERYGPSRNNGFISDGSFGYDDDLHVQCPPHTTERKMVARIDLHVIPFLCVLYLLG